MSLSIQKFHAEIITDSVNSRGDRLTSALLTFPRVVLSEFNTHRVFSRNSASSRAIPVWVTLREVLEEPYFPPRVGVNTAGMQAKEYLVEGSEKWLEYRDVYLRRRDLTCISVLEELVGSRAVEPVWAAYHNKNPKQVGQWTLWREIFDATLSDYVAGVKQKNIDDQWLNIHKQHTNRALEQFMWHTVLVTSSTFSNFFALRNNPDADPAIAIIAKMFQDAFNKSTPTLLQDGEWHLPLIQDDEREAANADPQTWRWVSAGRSARTSFLTHNGKRDISLDINLSQKRLAPHGHWSPFEHVAQASPDGDPALWGNFTGFTQWRKTFHGENDFSIILAEKEANHNAPQ